MVVLVRQDRLEMLWRNVLSLSVCLALAGAGRTQQQEKNAATEYHESFKGLTEMPERWSYVRPGAKKHVTFEPEGLRINLPTGKNPTGFVGVIAGYPIKGDFDMSVNFEILRETQEEKNAVFTSRLVLSAHMSPDVYGIQRALAEHTARFVAWHAVGGGKMKMPPTLSPSDSKSGRLRVVRRGERVYYYAAEGGNDFQLLKEDPVEEGDVKEIRIAAQTGGPEASIDVCFSDLRIVSGALVAARAAEASGATEIGSNRLLWLGIAGLLMAVLAISCVVLYLRLGKRAAEADEEPNEAEPLPISFACSGCGRNLDASAELAGKKVKCARCGATERVPVQDPGEARGGS